MSQAITGKSSSPLQLPNLESGLLLGTFLSSVFTFDQSQVQDRHFCVLCSHVLFSICPSFLLLCHLLLTDFLQLLSLSLWPLIKLPVAGAAEYVYSNIRTLSYSMYSALHGSLLKQQMLKLIGSSCCLSSHQQIQRAMLFPSCSIKYHRVIQMMNARFRVVFCDT